MNLQKDNPTFILKTFGCKVNQYESALIRQNLLNRGLSESRTKDVADCYIINSCTVTHKADRDTRCAIRHFHKINPSADIVVCGCSVEQDEDRELLSKIPGVTLLIRNEEKENASDILFGDSNSKKGHNIKTINKFKEKDRAFVKIQDGCNHRCSYCKVALVRGSSRSRDESEISSEIEALLKSGAKEIVLTGICLGAWGMDFKKKLSLNYLVKKISGLSKNFRLRLSSIEPLYVTENLIEDVASLSNVCKHFHIPLQSGDDKILELMNRPYRAKDFLQIKKRIDRKMPGFGLTTDIMIGFPGEDEKSFNKTLAFTKKIAPVRIHIFTYSERKGTQAFNMTGKAGPKETLQRRKRLDMVASSIREKYVNKLEREPVDVLIESARDKETGLLAGYTDTYIKVYIDGPDELFNSITPCRITHMENSRVFATNQ